MKFVKSAYTQFIMHIWMTISNKMVGIYDRANEILLWIRLSYKILCAMTSI